MGAASIAVRAGEIPRRPSWPPGCVIVGVDGSWCSGLALRWSVWACGRTGRNLEIRPVLGRSGHSDDTAVHAAHKLVHQLNPSLAVRCGQVAAVAANVLTDRQRAHDVVAVGWRGATSGLGAARISRAATVLDVVAQSRGATVVVRVPTGYRDGLRVVAAIARLPDDEPVLRWAAEFAAGQGDQLVVAHALPGAFGQRNCQRIEAQRAGQALLDHAATAIDDNRAGLPIHTALVRVPPHELLAHPLDADLLVIGSDPVCAGQPPAALVRAALQYAPCTVMVTPRTPEPGTIERAAPR